MTGPGAHKRRLTTRQAAGDERTVLPGGRPATTEQDGACERSAWRPRVLPSQRTGGKTQAFLAMDHEDVHLLRRTDGLANAEGEPGQTTHGGVPR